MIKYNLEKYADYFHDGFLLNAGYGADNLILDMWSSEVDEEDVNYEIPLFDNCMKGHLVIVRPNIIKYNNQVLDRFVMPCDHAYIAELIVSKKGVEISFYWTPIVNEMDEFWTVNIEGNEVYWIPDSNVINPYW